MFLFLNCEKVVVSRYAIGKQRNNIWALGNYRSFHTSVYRSFQNQEYLLNSYKPNKTKISFKKRTDRFFDRLGNSFTRLGLFLNSKGYKKAQAKFMVVCYIALGIYTVTFVQKLQEKKEYIKEISLRDQFQSWKLYEKENNSKDVSKEDLKDMFNLKEKEKILKILEMNDLREQKRKELQLREEELNKNGVVKVDNLITVAQSFKRGLERLDTKKDNDDLIADNYNFNLEELVANYNLESLEKPVNQYERLKLRNLTNPDKLRTRDVLKWQQYNYLLEEFGYNKFDDMFIEDYQTLVETIQQTSIPPNFYTELLENPETNKEFCKVLKKEEIHKVLPPRDTTDFFDDLAGTYDEAIKYEELFFINRQRKKLMNKLHGDCLETSCGTGRNIKYLKLKNVKSITFLDPSQKMLEQCKDKFEGENDLFQKVGFVKGKCEDLIANDKNHMKYDCVFETFGLCSQEDPLLSLNNMAKLLNPDGRIYLLEHGKSNIEMINENMAKGVEQRLAKWGCRYNMDLGEIVDDSDLEIVSEKRMHLGTTWVFTLKLKGSPERIDEKHGLAYIRAILK
ncbi:hypothetical protein ACO0SA_000326 [Hanseniaspora valbyensis]